MKKINPFATELLDSIELPVLPEIVLKLNKMIREDAPNLEEIVALIESDAAIQLEVLRLAGTAKYGDRPKNVTTAVLRLGFTQLRDTLTLTTIRRRFANVSPKMVDTREYWEHGLMVGASTVKIVEQEKIKCSVDPFVAGVLSNIGELILLQIMPDDFARGLYMHKDTEDRLDLEQVEFRCTHKDIGAQLMLRWDLADEFIQTALNYLSPSNRVTSLPEAVALAVECAHHFPECPRFWADRRTNDSPDSPELVAASAEEYAERKSILGV